MKELIYNGHALPIHFGMRALSSFARSVGMEFSDTLDPTKIFEKLETIITLTPHALNEGARKSGDKEKRYTEEEVWDMVDDDPLLINQISTIFMESITPLMQKLGSMTPTPSADSEKKSNLS